MKLELATKPVLPEPAIPQAVWQDRTNLLTRFSPDFKVDSETNMAIAAKWSADIQAFCKSVKKDADAIREPAKSFIGVVDKIEDGLTEDLERRRKSLNVAQGDYIQAQDAKRRSLEAAQREELLSVGREREAKLAQCDTIEAREAVQEEYSAKIAEINPPIAVEPMTIKGQRVSGDIEIEVTDIWKLAMSHSHLVRIEPKLADIKAHIKAGLAIQGVRWKPKISVTNVGTAPRMTISVPPPEPKMWEKTGITVD